MFTFYHALRKPFPPGTSVCSVVEQELGLIDLKVTWDTKEPISQASSSSVTAPGLAGHVPFL